MADFRKYSVFLRDNALSAKDLISETGPGFDNELERVLSAYSSAEAFYGVIYITPQEASLFNMGSRISGIFKRAELIALFVTTLGSDYNSISQRYREDPLLYYLSDLVASAYTERCADIAHKKVSQDAANMGLKCSNRYSPGYCGWKTEEQKKLFSLLPASPCGITLTESSLMNPVKSVSAAIAIGKEIKFIKHDCSGCYDDNCVYKKKYIL
jgi:hypothetical protein